MLVERTYETKLANIGYLLLKDLWSTTFCCYIRKLIYQHVISFFRKFYCRFILAHINKELSSSSNSRLKERSLINVVALTIENKMIVWNEIRRHTGADKYYVHSNFKAILTFWNIKCIWWNFGNRFRKRYHGWVTLAYAVM